MKRILLTLTAVITFAFITKAQNVNIPDANFKSYLLGNSSINTDADASEISVAEASAFTGSITVTNQSISDLTGIEAFTAITNLYCSNNFLTSLDVSQNVDLIILYCKDNALTSLDVSQNSAINRLDCSENDLSILNVANGNNSNFNFFYAISNPNLTCIEVDNELYSTSNWSSIDATASFSVSCSVLVNTITVDGQGGFSTISTPGGTLQMEAEILPMNADDLTYTWSVTNGTGSATIDASGLLTALTNGTVEVTATANDASGTTGTKTITIYKQTVGINNLTFENASIFPNPTNGIINLNVPEELSSIRIMDLTGKTIKVFYTDSKQLDITAFTQGIYFLEIANAEKKSVVKVLKK